MDSLLSNMPTATTQMSCLLSCSKAVEYPLATYWVERCVMRTWYHDNAHWNLAEISSCFSVLPKYQLKVMLFTDNSSTGCLRVLEGAQGCSGCSRVLEGAQGCSRVLEGVRGCSRVLCRRMALNKRCIMVPPLRLYESRIFDLTMSLLTLGLLTGCLLLWNI